MSDFLETLLKGLTKKHTWLLTFHVQNYGLMLCSTTKNVCYCEKKYTICIVNLNFEYNSGDASFKYI